MRRRLNLQEHMRSEPHRLSIEQRESLRKAELSLTMEPAAGTGEAYHLTPGSVVGAVEVGDLSVLIAPKIGIPQLLTLVCFAGGTFDPGRELFDYPRDEAPADVLALALGSAARRPSGAACFTGTAVRTMYYRLCAAGSGSTSRFGGGTGLHRRSRFASTNSPTTSWRTGS